jgi:hypothetical protein
MENCLFLWLILGFFCSSTIRAIIITNIQTNIELPRREKKEKIDQKNDCEEEDFLEN